MKKKIGMLLCLVALVSVIAGLGYIFYPLRPNAAAVHAVAETRQLLRQQGFKTDLDDFNFSTTSEEQAIEAILTRITLPSGIRPEIFYPNLQQSAGSNSAIIVWKLDSLDAVPPPASYDTDQLSWDGFRAATDENQHILDAVCATVMSGPIAFNLNANGGSAMRLPHLAMLKNLTQTLGNRTVLALHDGNQDAAWTNLLAATRLVTAWNPEPAEISHLVRFNMTSLTLGSLWQALQTNHWPDENLLRLQREWESADFFTNLPEVMAFTRASVVAQCQQDRQMWRSSPLPGGSLVSLFLHSPSDAWRGLQYRTSQRQYYRLGTYEDEKNLLLFYRDREVEFRNAIQTPTWMQMRQLPGVTNRTVFQSKYRSRLQTILNLREISVAFQREGASFLGRAATAESQRRLIITAIALERYRGKYGSYPNSLALLTPEFLEIPLLDFMDGQPLRYRLTDDGCFLLYSVGLDCEDHGGTMPAHEFATRFTSGATRFESPPPADILWPLPAGTDAVQQLREQQTRAEQSRYYQEEQRISAEDWQQSPSRQSRVTKILANKWTADPNDVTYQGRRLSDAIRNGNFTDTNHVSLADLLTPRQIITGKEPEELTFEIPINYDMVTNHGKLTLLADADPDDMESDDSGAKVQEFARATNNNCLLTWHTIFDPPGPHALQVILGWVSQKGGIFIARGVAIPVTTSNLCQFSLDSSSYDVDLGALFHARLPEKHAQFSIECVTTNGAPLKTLTGVTTNGEFNVVWNLVADDGHRLKGETFNSIVHLTFQDSGRTQTLRGP